MISPQILQSYPLFSGQSEVMLKKIAMLGSEIIVDEDDWIFEQDQSADHFYIIREGGVSLTMNYPGSDGTEQSEGMSSLGAGEIIGWSALQGPKTYVFGAQAVEETTLIRFQGGKLMQLFGVDPEYGYPFIKHISEVIGERLEFKCIQLLSLEQA